MKKLNLVFGIIAFCLLTGCSPKDWSEYAVEDIVINGDNSGDSGGGSGDNPNPEPEPDPNPDPEPLPVPEVKSHSYILLGDIHYCEERFYDLTAMETDKPSDYRQITQTYAPVTKANWVDQIKTLKAAVEKTLPEVKGVIQLGDVSEGLGNFAGAPEEMAKNVVAQLKAANIGVPWVLVKGNHDITGVGTGMQDAAKAAYVANVTPFIREQTGVNDITDATYSFEKDGVLVVVLDAYNSKQNQTQYAKSVLEKSKAKIKLVCMHEPAVPVSEKCWHYLRTKPADREAFLKVIAENKAIFLAGHLHRYSVLRRNTQWGPIVQVMANSVTNLARTSKPSYDHFTDQAGKYGDILINWKSITDETIINYLRTEQPYVDYFKMNALAGFAVLSINAETPEPVVSLTYFTAFDENTPYDTVNLTELYSKSSN